MSKSTTIVNHLNTDRVIEITISDHKYIVFTLMYRKLIVLDITNKDNAVLLLNNSYDNRNALSKGIDHIIIIATRAIDTEDFTSNMDTYIELNDIGNNETVEEILAAYKIIMEDYNL